MVQYRDACFHSGISHAVSLNPIPYRMVRKLDSDTMLILTESQCILRLGANLMYKDKLFEIIESNAPLNGCVTYSLGMNTICIATRISSPEVAHVDDRFTSYVSNIEMQI